MNVTTNYLFVICAIIFLAGCGKLRHQEYNVFVSDDIELLKQQTIDWVEKYDYPKGLAFTVYTVDSLNTATIGAEGDDIYDISKEIVPNRKAFSRRGVLLIVSRSPSLVQVRVGNDIYNQALWKGVITGSEYIEKQNIALNGNIDSAIVEMVKYLARRIPEAEDVPWYRDWIVQDLAQSLYFELRSLSLPSNSFYGQYLLKPASAVRVVEIRVLGTWWVTYLIYSVIVFVLTSVILKKVLLWLKNIVIKKQGSRKVADLIHLSIFGIVSVALAVPTAASAIILAGGRMEDQIALKSSEIPGIEQLTFDATYFDQSTGIWMVILLFIARIIKGFADRGWMAGLALLPEERQRKVYMNLKDETPVGAFILEASATGDSDSIFAVSEEEFEQNPFGSSYTRMIFYDVKAGFRWALLAGLILPLSLSMAVVYFWIVPTTIGIIRTIQSVRKWK